jgi:hypothetical protein
MFRTRPAGPSASRDGRAMPHRADRLRIYVARRSVLFAKLTTTRAIDNLEAEHRISSWECDAEGQALGC